MIKNLRKQVYILLVSLLIMFSLGMDPAPIQVTVTEKLKQETVRVVELKVQLAELQRLLLRQKKVDCVINYYKKAGTYETWWWLNRDFILSWFEFCDKWKFLAGEETKDMADFMIGVIHSESNGNRWAKKCELDKTCSYGITQINDTCIKTIEKELDEKYPEFKGRDIRWDVEKNIAGRYLWIIHRKNSGKSWALISKNGWTLVWYLSQVKI